jgi:chromosome segregation ATPase
MSSARGRNPFGDDDDGDYKFGNKGGSGDGRNSGEDELKRIQAQIGHVENESLSSTQRALRALNEAEEVGTKTAAELVAQGEKLQSIEDTMDGVNEKLNSTQKNLNQLKGFFGGFKVSINKYTYN